MYIKAMATQVIGTQCIGLRLEVNTKTFHSLVTNNLESQYSDSLFRMTRASCYFIEPACPNRPDKAVNAYLPHIPEFSANYRIQPVSPGIPAQVLIIPENRCYI